MPNGCVNLFYWSKQPYSLFPHGEHSCCKNDFEPRFPQYIWMRRTCFEGVQQIRLKNAYRNWGKQCRGWYGTAVNSYVHEGLPVALSIAPKVSWTCPPSRKACHLSIILTIWTDPIWTPLSALGKGDRDIVSWDRRVYFPISTIVHLRLSLF